MRTATLDRHLDKGQSCASVYDVPRAPACAGVAGARVRRASDISYCVCRCMYDPVFAPLVPSQ